MEVPQEAGNVCESKINAIIDNEIRRGNKITIGEGTNRREYIVCLPGEYDDLGEPSDPAVEKYLNPCTNEIEAEERSCNDHHYLIIELDELNSLYLHLKYLVNLGYVNIDSIHPKIWHKGETNCDLVPNLSHSEQQLIQTRIFNSYGTKNESSEKFKTLKRMAAQSIFQSRSVIANVKIKVQELDIESKNLCEVMDELEEIVRTKAACINNDSLIEQKQNICCVLIRKYPLRLTLKLPSPTPSEISHRLVSYSTNESFRKTLRDDAPSPSRLITFRIEQCIHTFPNGAASEAFWKKFKKNLQYVPSAADMGARNLNEALLMQEGVLYISDFRNDNLPQIFFAACMKGIASVMSIIKKYYHHIKVLLAEQKFFKLEDTHQVLVAKYKIEFDPEDWNFSPSEFVKVCIELMNHENHVIIFSFSTPVDPRKIGNQLQQHSYVCINSPSVTKQVYAKYCVHSTATKFISKVSKPTSKRCVSSQFSGSLLPRNKLAVTPGVSYCSDSGIVINSAPKKYVILHDVIDGIANYLSSDETLTGEIVSFDGPESFAVHLAYYKERLDCFLIELWRNESFKQSLDQNSKLDYFDPFKIGQYVMAFHKLYTRPTPKWYRGRVLAMVDTSTYEIYFLDHGCKTVVKSSNVRPMLNSIFTFAPAFAIPCRLNMSPEEDGAGAAVREFSSEEAGAMKEIVSGKILLICFHSSTFNTTIGSRVWEVAVKHKEKSERWVDVSYELFSKRSHMNPESSSDSDSSTDWIARYLNDVDND